MGEEEPKRKHRPLATRPRPTAPPSTTPISPPPFSSSLPCHLHCSLSNFYSSLPPTRGLARKVYLRQIMVPSAPVPSDDAEDCSSATSTPMPTMVSSFRPPSNRACTCGGSSAQVWATCLAATHKTCSTKCLKHFFFVMLSADNLSGLHLQERPGPANPAFMYMVCLLFGLSFLRTKRLLAHDVVRSPMNGSQPGAAHLLCSSPATSENSPGASCWKYFY